MHPESPFQVIKGPKELAIIQAKCGRTEQLGLEFRRLRLLISFRDDIWPASIISLYQPEKKLFWWAYVQHSESDLEKISDFSVEKFNFNYLINRYLSDNQLFLHVSENKIIRFSLLEGALTIRKSSARCKSIEEAYNKVLFILEKNLEELDQCHFYKWTLVLSFADITEYFFRLEEEFFSAMPRFFGKILNVTYLSNAMWQIELEGTYQRKATLILKDRYENVEEPLLLTNDYYQNTRVLMRRNSYYLERGLPIPDYHYELLEVWKEGVKKD